MTIPNIGKLTVDLTPPSRQLAPDNYDDVADQWAHDIQQGSLELNSVVDQINTVTSAIDLAAAETRAAADVAGTAVAAANFVGRWSAQSGAASVPYSAFHQGSIWMLLTNVAAVEASEPNANNSDWHEMILNVSMVVNVATQSINLSQGRWFEKTINANTVFTFDNVPPVGGVLWIVDLTLNSGDITWPSSVIWPGDITPVLTPNKRHQLVFTTRNGGNQVLGALLRDYPL